MAWGMAADIYGTPPVYQPAVTDQSFSGTDATSTTRGLKSLLDPRNPVVWFGAILLITVGAAGVAGSVRLGPAAVGGKIGKA